MDALGYVLFWGSSATLVWIFLGFASLVVLVGSLRPRPVRRQSVEPRVTVIIAAHEEEAGIAEKLRNTLGQHYPEERLDVVLASDGSDDRTVEIARAFEGARLRVLDLPRRGKIFALDEAVQAADGEVLVFTDANTELEPDAIARLVQPFADPGVGGVCGNQGHRRGHRAEAGADEERFYWRWDRWLKQLESRTGSIVSADGALYGIRAGLYRRPAHPSLNDDFAISTAVVAQGLRLVYEPAARAWEPTAGRAADEFERKVRILTRGLWSVHAARELLHPRFGFYAMVLFTHKVLRRLTPLFLVSLLAGSLLLGDRGGIYTLAVVAQGVFYGLAGLGGLLRRRLASSWKVLGAPFFFCLANAAALVALVAVLRGRPAVLWRPRRRDASA